MAAHAKSAAQVAAKIQRRIPGPRSVSPRTIKRSSIQKGVGGARQLDRYSQDRAMTALMSPPANLGT